MKKLLDCSVYGYKYAEALNGGNFNGDGNIAILTENNISFKLDYAEAYSNPRFSKIERFLIDAGKSVFVEYVKPGYDISGSGLKEFKRVDGTTIMINMSNVCMIEPFWLAEFTCKAYSAYDGKICHEAFLIRDNDEAVLEMLKTGNIGRYYETI